MAEGHVEERVLGLDQVRGLAAHERAQGSGSVLRPGRLRGREPQGDDQQEPAAGRASAGASILVAGLLALACVAPPSPPAPAPPEPLPAPAPEPPRALPPPCERIVAIQVFKSERRLVAECEGGAQVTLRVALGRDPDGPKRRAGDLRTPEGTYHVTGPARPSRFHRFLPIDYPSPADADAGLAEGRIDAAQHRRILRAHEAGFAPPADTPLGSGLGFHGEGARWRGDSLHLDWTTGCIAMSDDAIEFLAEHVAPGTPVTIHP